MTNQTTTRPYRFTGGPTGIAKHYESDEDNNRKQLKPGDVVHMTEKRYQALSDRFEYAPDLDKPSSPEPETATITTSEPVPQVPQVAATPEPEPAEESVPDPQDVLNHWAEKLNVPWSTAAKMIEQTDSVTDLHMIKKAEHDNRNRPSVMKAIDVRLSELNG